MGVRKKKFCFQNTAIHFGEQPFPSLDFQQRQTDSVYIAFDKDQV